MAVVGVCTALVAASGVGAANKMASPVKVTVNMTDFKFKLSKTSVPKNTPVVFTVINKGPSPHDFDPVGTRGTKVIPTGTRTTMRATFRRAGKVRYICTVPRHASFGMVGNLTVK
jgi:plastocyanin